MNIKSNFYFVLIGYFREISDIKGDKSAGEHQRSVEDAFDGKIWETEPVSGLFYSREQEKRGDPVGVAYPPDHILSLYHPKGFFLS